IAWRRRAGAEAPIGAGRIGQVALAVPGCTSRANSGPASPPVGRSVPATVSRTTVLVVDRRDPPVPGHPDDGVRDGLHQTAELDIGPRARIFASTRLTAF